MNGDYNHVAMQADALERKVARLEKTLGTLIAWMAQSANSPISLNEARELLQILERETS